jgi:hypothetical protein
MNNHQDKKKPTINFWLIVGRAAEIAAIISSLETLINMVRHVS